MTIKAILRAAVLAGVLGAVAGAAAARSSNMIEPARQAIVTPDGKPMSLESVRQAILTGGARHGWKPVGEQDGVLTLQADSGSHQAVVDVAYDAQGYQITYKSSANLNYTHTDSKTSIHPKYNKWVENLGSSIRGAMLGAPSPSASQPD